MYKIESAIYGFKLTFSGCIGVGEMKQWLDGSERILASAPPEFGLVVDMRDLESLPPEVLPLLHEGQRLYRQKGMQRSAVVLNDAAMTMQLGQIAKDTSTDAWTRHIDASAERDWEDVAVCWVADGVFEPGTPVHV
ncbi:MAG: hypothetical protein JXB62_06190 [Pirellulales bacterium]|nr:hypothetical protein [Pirellulales bacterium]